ncbi:hypothetical protein JAAARDRAFT_201266 [Jaapia argillacea MUCL 33604]|uniref:Uncharacterized protein n=1 Tax=Jaapia argillacea MUCL 33604 TaxID=933084 RepID=A0A067P236_9AGAM|nr:hypothetical protein JAAARDRAFT_201266 [Jaapia argillacea MUCL 33604]
MATYCFVTDSSNLNSPSRGSRRLSPNQFPHPEEPPDPCAACRPGIDTANSHHQHPARDNTAANSPSPLVMSSLKGSHTLEGSHRSRVRTPTNRVDDCEGASDSGASLKETWEEFDDIFARLESAFLAIQRSWAAMSVCAEGRQPDVGLSLSDPRSDSPLAPSSKRVPSSGALSSITADHWVHMPWVRTLSSGVPDSLHERLSWKGGPTMGTPSSVAVHGLYRVYEETTPSLGVVISPKEPLSLKKGPTVGTIDSICHMGSHGC